MRTTSLPRVSGLAPAVWWPLAGCQTFWMAPFENIQPPTDGEVGRWVFLEGANNTRDVGGYVTVNGKSVKWNTVYRSGALSRLNSVGCDTFRDLGIRYVVDMRDRLLAVPLFDGDVLCVHESAAVVLRRVIAADDGGVERWYLDTFIANSESYRRMFEDLTAPEHLPLLYHCAAGKDRTGIMTALLLTLLGVDRGTVMEEYRLSERISPLVDGEAMEYLLDDVDAKGGIQPFLTSYGVSAQTQAAIRQNLLE